MKSGNLEELRSVFINSNEFRNKLLKNGMIPIGRHIGVHKLSIEVETSTIHSQTMLDRIARNWQKFGESEPHWSVLTNPIFLREALDGHIEDFFQHGNHDVEILINPIRRSGLNCSNFKRIMDFGCGVGRLTAALSRYGDEVVGVDISKSHLREAESAMRSRSITNLKLSHIERIEDISALGTFDLIISRIVLQHNPPPVMAAIYRKLLQSLRKSGCASIQIPTFIDGYEFYVDRYLSSEAPQMEMNALPQHQIFKIIAEENCVPLEVREDAGLGDIDGLSHIFAVMRR